MNFRSFTAALTLAATLAQAAPPPKQKPLEVTTWFSLREAAPESPAAAFRDLAEPAAPKGVEQITVVGARRSRRDQMWREELAARVPSYEAGASDAAQPLVPYAKWTSPDEERMMSGAKEELGLCHWPLTCPDP